MAVPTPKKEQSRPAFLPLILETKSSRSEDIVARRLLRRLKEITDSKIVKAGTPASTPIKAKRIFGAKFKLAATFIEEALDCAKGTSLE